jgi:predicted metal-binding membrane protein
MRTELGVVAALLGAAGLAWWSTADRMAGMDALGVMSLTWMALIAVLVALEKVGPWRRGARLATAGVLVVLAAALLAVPHEVPGFVLPGSRASPSMMKAVG